MEAFRLTVKEIVEGIRSRELSPIDLTKSVLERVKNLDSKLKAWAYIDENKVLSDAYLSEQALQSGGECKALEGVPVGMKDIYFREGVPTTAGSKIYSDFIPDYDATTVSLLKSAGALMIGNTVTTEFACSDPSPTINPWNPLHTPGGSSSGSAVAVSSMMCPLAFGSQTVGSVLRPAAYNGVVGFKPTFGRVSRYGVIPVSWSLDTVGWMTRNVADAALVLQVVAGRDQNDPVSSNVPINGDTQRREGDSSTTVGLVRGYFDVNADQETRDHLNVVAKTIENMGYIVEELDTPQSLDHHLEDQQLVMSVEAATFHQKLFEEREGDYQPKLRKLLADGLNVNAMDYSRAQERRRKFIFDMENFAKKADILLMPSTPTPALADLTNTGDPKFQGPWTSCGFPAISIPSGISASGLPLGIQLVASSFKERLLLSVAGLIESALDVRLVPQL